MAKLPQVGLNLLFLHPGLAGVGVYARELTRSLLEEGRGRFRYLIFVGVEGESLIPEPDPEVGRTLVVDVAATRKLKKLWVEQRRLPALAREHQLALLHSFDYSAPLMPGVPQTVTFHDLNYLSHPETFSLSARWVRRILVPRVARAADRVITISEASARQIVERLSLPPSRVAVCGSSGRRSDSAAPRRLVSEDAHGDGMLLAVGTLNRHKNYQRLIRAYAGLDVGLRSQFPLVIAGKDGSEAEDVRALIRWEGLEDSVRLTGYLDEPELHALYSSATLLVMPSLYEGFGMPVVEAMQTGLPVLCSQIEPLTSICGPAAEYFNPGRVEGITKALERLLESPDRRRELSAKGIRRAELFSWEAVAKSVTNVHEDILRDEPKHHE